MADTAVESAPPTDQQDVSVEIVNNNKADVTPQNGAAKSSKSRDDLAPASGLWVTRKDAAVEIRMGKSGPLSSPPTTVLAMFENTVKKVPSSIAMAVKVDNKWKQWTYQQYYDDVIKVAKSFMKLGLEPFNGVGILGFNSPEWFLSQMGCIYACGLSVGIYTTNTPEACQYVLGNSSCNIAVVEDNVQLQKIIRVWDKLPNLKAIIQYRNEVAERRENVYSWEEFMNLSSEVPDSALAERQENIAPNKACILVYTSGTTGNPKGVMISHDNITWITAQSTARGEWGYNKDVVVSYLPLSHVAAQLMDVHLPYHNAAAVYFAQPDALKGSLKNTLLEVRPTKFFGVPRVWEKLAAAMQEQGRQVTGLKKKIAVKAKQIGLKGCYNAMEGQPKPTGWKLADIVVFKKVKKRLGLDRCTSFATGAAPIMKETLDYFYSLNIPLLSVYGMSENAGPQCCESNSKYKVGTVGYDMDGCMSKFVNPDSDGAGEICIWGRHVFMGYLNEEEKTKEAIDEDGWLHTGDIGKRDESGFVYVTGRIKEILITAGGENIAPVPIEDNVKEALPIIGNCMLIGDKKKFLSMLLCLKTVIDINTGEPTDNLTPDAIDWCKSVNSEATTVKDILDKQDANVFKGIQGGIDKANDKAVSRAAKIQKWSILPRDFSIPGGELGPTMKLRRPIVVKMYEKTIETFYAET